MFNTKLVIFFVVAFCAMPTIYAIINGLPVTEPTNMVLVERFTKSNVVKRCSGALISSSHVMTAAHCATSKSTGSEILGALQEEDIIFMRLSFGTLPFGHPDRLASSQNVTRSNIKVHPKYVAAPLFDFDIAIIILPREVSGLDISIIPAYCSKPEVGTKATVTGAGMTNLYTGTYATGPRIGNVTIVSRLEAFLTIPLSILNTGVFSKGVDFSICTGDSGGPITITSPDGQVVVAGVTSYGGKDGCGLGSIIGSTSTFYCPEFLELYTQLVGC